MNCKLRFLMLICTYIISVPAIASEQRIILSHADKDQSVITAQKLARCGGVYDTASEIQKVINNPAFGLNIHEMANGAEVAAAFLMASTDIIRDWRHAVEYAENTRNSEKARQAALFQAVENHPEQIKKLINNLVKSINECSALGEIQSELVQKAKSWAYAGQPK